MRAGESGEARSQRLLIEAKLRPAVVVAAWFTGPGRRPGPRAGLKAAITR